MDVPLRAVPCGGGEGPAVPLSAQAQCGAVPLCPWPLAGAGFPVETGCGHKRGRWEHTVTSAALPSGS